MYEAAVGYKEYFLLLIYLYRQNNKFEDQVEKMATRTSTYMVYREHIYRRYIRSSVEG